MTNPPNLTETTVTVFGDNEALDHAISDQLSSRGVRTHAVSVPTGWLRSATYAVMRVDTAAGADALRSLAQTSAPRSHVVAVGVEPSDPSESERVREMCRRCGRHHDISLIWHPPLSSRAPDAAIPPAVTTHAVAATVADEVLEHGATGLSDLAAHAAETDGDPH